MSTGDMNAVAVRCSDWVAEPGQERRVNEASDAVRSGVGGWSESVTLAEGVTLIHGDCLSMWPIKADAVISDPPYGISHRRGKCSDRGKGITRGASGIIGDSEAFDPSPWVEYPIVALWGGNWFSTWLPNGGWLVWDKQEHGGSGDFSEAEIAWKNAPGAIKVFRHMWLGVQRASQVGEPRRHPTEKPVALMAWTMERAKVPAGATVLDPYMGSGTTGVACIRTGRKFIGIERDRQHFETAVERMRSELAQGVLPFGGGAEPAGEQLDAFRTEPRSSATDEICGESRAPKL